MNHGLKVSGNVLEITLPDGIDIEKVVVNGKVFSPPQQAGELQKHQRVAQKRRYTFGNDEFSLEAAYHDCKLVFDGITDDESFQGADTGLILYYANEIIYALQEALENKDTNVLSNDTISRQDAINAFEPDHPVDWYTTMIVDVLENLPSAELDPCSFCKHNDDCGHMLGYCPAERKEE